MSRERRSRPTAHVNMMRSRSSNLLRPSARPSEALEGAAKSMPVSSNNAENRSSLLAAPPTAKDEGERKLVGEATMSILEVELKAMKEELASSVDCAVGFEDQQSRQGALGQSIPVGLSAAELSHVHGLPIHADEARGPGDQRDGRADAPKENMDPTNRAVALRALLPGVARRKSKLKKKRARRIK